MYLRITYIAMQCMFNCDSMQGNKYVSMRMCLIPALCECSQARFSIMFVISERLAILIGMP